MIALDTNVLVYAHREGAPEHERARGAVLAALRDSRGWGICLPTVSEFWSIAPNHRRDSLHTLRAGINSERPPQRRVFRTVPHFLEAPDCQIALCFADAAAREHFPVILHKYPLPGFP